LKVLIEAAVQRAVITEAQRDLPVRAKQAGDDGAHGQEVSGARARSALIALRRFIGEF
jgi:hypothetical protein